MVAVREAAPIVGVVAALRLQPKLVVVVADPGLTVVAEVALAPEAAFELVEEGVGVDPVVADRIAVGRRTLERVRPEAGTAVEKPRDALGECGRGSEGEERSREGEGCRRAHQAPFGRTRRVRNMPASKWYRMWQCSGHCPVATGVTSIDSFSAGATLTVWR